MAADPAKDRKKITIVGQSASGKTNMLASLMFNNNVMADLKQPSRDPGLIGPARQRMDTDGEVAKHTDWLHDHYGKMLAGKDGVSALSTDEVRKYLLEVSFKQDTGQVNKSLWGGTSEPVLKEERIQLEIADGRGGDWASDIADDKMSDGQKARRLAYRDALDVSVAKIICMPIRGEYQSAIASRAIKEIRLAIERKRADPKLPPLERVAICYTKYESEFVDRGSDAMDYASDPDVFKAIMMGHASRAMFSDFVLKNSGPEACDIRFFPVSSYGFTEEANSANYYGYRHAPGLKTRAIDEYYDYDDEDLPDYKAHFPHPLSQEDAEALWWPYNVAPPFIFALTGIVTGPLSLSPEELGFTTSDAYA